MSSPYGAGNKTKSGGSKDIFYYLSILNNIRKNLLRLYRKQKFKISHLWLFPFVFVYSEFFLRAFTGTGVFAHFIYPLVFGVSAGLLCAALTSLFRRKTNRIVSMILLYLTAGLFILQCLLHQSYQVYMTLSAVLTGAEGVAGGYASEAFSAIFHGIPEMFIFLLPAILYTGTGRRRMPAKRYPKAFAGILVIASLLLFAIGSIAASHGAYSTIYKGQQNFNTSSQTFGLITGMRLDASNALFGKNKKTGLVVETPPEPENVVEEPTVAVEVKTEITGDNVMELPLEELMNSDDSTVAEISTYVNSLTPTNKNEYTGLFEGKNLILICAEAFSDVVVNPELTPTLYRMVHNGFYFPEFYQPTWGGSTSSGEYSFVFGLVPMRGVDTIQATRTNNNYFTMGNQLQRLGYYSMAYHSSDYDYYDRNLTHENLGYAQFLGQFNGIEEICGDYAGDEDLLNLTLDTYIDKQPFSIYYMTLSGHCAYKESSRFVTKYLDQVKSVLGDKYKDTTLYYFCYQMELETALTTMIKKLEDAGIADDTVICMTADHYPYGLENTATFGNSEDYVADLYGGTYSNSWEKDHNTLIIWSGCLENENKDMACEISAPTYTLDILPTLSNLFGLEYDSRLMVGRDVFSDAEPLVVWNDYSWATTYGKYDSWNGKFIPNPGYEEYADNETYINSIHQKVSNILSVSDEILGTDYYRILFGEDDITDNSHWVAKTTVDKATVVVSPSPSPSAAPNEAPEG